MSRERKSFVTIAISPEAYKTLLVLKKAFNARSFSDVITRLAEYYYESRAQQMASKLSEKRASQPVKPITPEQEADEIISPKPDLAAATKLICTKHPEARASRNGWSRILLAEGVPVELIEEVIEEALEPCPGDPDMLCVKEEACAAAQ